MTSVREPLVERVYITDQLFQEDHYGTSSYHDRIGEDHTGSTTPGLYVEVEYDKTEQPYLQKTDYKGDYVTFKSRDELLDHEVARRMDEVKDLPDSERYVGFELTLLQKIKRLFNINIDRELQDQWETALKPNYSAKNVYNMTNTINPSQAIREQLGLAKSETHRLATKVNWAFNSSLNGYEYIDEAGKKVKIRNATTSSNDRTTRNICMMRRIDDAETNETIAYTGRPDNRDKALEQIEFMFRSELEKGLTKGEDGVYTLTYAVTNLLSPISGIGLFAFDEKKATLDEQAIFQKLYNNVIEIDGKKVRVKPLYFSQPFNQTNSLTDIITDSHSGKGLSKEINAKGYETLIPMAEKHLEAMEKGNKKDFLEGAIRALKGDFSSLNPEEEFFNRAVICQALGIKLVIHCKSSTDRTLLAQATASVAHQWSKLDLDLIRGKDGHVIPHLILQNEAAQELVAGHCLGGHQITRVSRTCEGVVKGHEIGTRILGFDWSSNPIAGRILPKRYTKDNDISVGKRGLVGFFSTVGFVLNLLASPLILLIGGIASQKIFNPIFIKPGISPFADRLIDPLSPYVGEGKGRSMLKPEGMVAL